MQPTSISERSLTAIARQRAENLTSWLKENAPQCFREQKHLDAGSAERAYWHYGYLSALRDIITLISDPRSN